MVALIVKLFAATAAAFGLHRFYLPSMELGERWGSMFREVIGVIALWPFVIILADEIPAGNRSEDYARRYSIAYALGMLFFGAGVLLGHLFDRTKSA